MPGVSNKRILTLGVSIYKCQSKFFIIKLQRDLFCSLEYLRERNCVFEDQYNRDATSQNSVNSCIVFQYRESYSLSIPILMQYDLSGGLLEASRLAFSLVCFSSHVFHHQPFQLSCSLPDRTVYFISVCFYYIPFSLSTKSFQALIHSVLLALPLVMFCS